MFGSHGSSFIAASRVRQSPVWISSLAVRIEKIKRGSLALVFFPDRCPRGSYPLRGVVKLSLADAESDVRIFGQCGRPRPLVQGKAEPQIAGKEVSASAPPHQRLRTQRFHVELKRPLDIPHRESDVVETGDHEGGGAVWRSNARRKVATAPSTAVPIPR